MWGFESIVDAYESSNMEMDGVWSANDPELAFSQDRALQLTGFWNSTFSQANNFTGRLKPLATDLSMTTVLSSLYVNGFLFICLVITYEFLRRHFPTVYAPKLYRIEQENLFGVKEHAAVGRLPPTSKKPLGWVAPVFGVSWLTVRKVGGLDAYFFLRYIRMCLRITAVSSFWALIILFPVYATGRAGGTGWYHLSMANIRHGDWRTWVSVAFIYLLSLFCFFVMKQEYVHFLQLRMDFLGREDRTVNPQHHYSLMVENIPMELRSDVALGEYFEALFPGKIHSASVIMNLPQLETLSANRLRVTKQLEKAIALMHATGERPSHIVKDEENVCCGIDFDSKECCVCMKKRVIVVEERGELPQKGAHVDSISYYTRVLVECNRELFLLQEHKTRVAETGNTSARAANESWFVKVVDAATEAASTIIRDSEEVNALGSPHDSGLALGGGLPLAERMTSFYGSFGGHEKTGAGVTPTTQKRKKIGSSNDLASLSLGGGNGFSIRDTPTVSWGSAETNDKKVRLVIDDHMDHMASRSTEGSIPVLNKQPEHMVAPGSRNLHASCLRRIIGRCGLDFVVAGLRYLQSHLDVMLAEVVGARMSSTGFVTFLDLASLTSAASVPLTHKPNILKVAVAPEPRDIRWSDAHIPQKVIKRRCLNTNILLVLGVLLWSIPITFIQAFATAQQVARIPGLSWILTFQHGKYTVLINGYLPVVALLTLILILPIIFQAIAEKYEHRKTRSEVQRSVLFRYFYYQLANIYITVTAGSLWNSLADILNNPSAMFHLLGKSLPTVVGYFVSLLITKILAGLPLISLRGGALSRKLLYRLLFSQTSLTQRELDEIHHPENVQYGWEYPMQLLVIVICFTYACISPIILPVGAIFFAGALMVYKKQVLYVYTPEYESGGAFFPMACDCTLFGLVCGQVTLIGYFVIRKSTYEPAWLLPLPFITVWVMMYYRRHYAKPSDRLSMERAMERDRVSDVKASMKANAPMVPGCGMAVTRDMFCKEAYRQPVLTERLMEPLPYRRNHPDEATKEACGSIRKRNRMLMVKSTTLAHDFSSMMSDSEEEP